MANSTNYQCSETSELCHHAVPLPTFEMMTSRQGRDTPESVQTYDQGNYICNNVVLNQPARSTRRKFCANVKGHIVQSQSNVHTLMF